MLKSQKAIGEYLTLPKLTLEQVAHNSQVAAEKYLYGDERGQYILYFGPVKKASKHVIIFIHGGGWIAGSPERYKFIGQKFADMGYHTISLGYRHTPLNKYPAQAEDVFSGYCKAMIILIGKGIKIKDIIIVGSSAGGHLGGILTYDKNLQAKYGVDPENIKGFISLGGILTFGVDYARYTRNLMNALFEKDYDRVKAEPYAMVDGTEKTKVLCIHSQNDPVSAIQNETLFVDRINSFHKGYGEKYIVKDETIFHSNLVTGIFFEDPENSPSLKELFRWIKALPTKGHNTMTDSKTVVFDLDGTLLDTLEDLADGVNFALTKSGYPARTLEEVRLFVGNGVRNLIEQSIPGGMGNPDFEPCLHDFKEHYSKNMQNKTRPYDGVMELLETLRSAGIKTAIVSNKFDKAVKELSKEYFGDNIAVSIGESARIHKKPAPDCVYEALNELVSEPGTAVYVGDSEVDVRTAHNAGLPCVGVTWGFRGKEILVKEGAEYIIDHPLELLDILKIRPVRSDK